MISQDEHLREFDREKVMKKEVYCEKCERLALAKIDETPYCTSCLVFTLGKPPKNTQVERIHPLEIVRNRQNWALHRS